ncbi:hypothetical protein Fot_30058 [Forsythia ovata]|uniref:Uncharacterized protein n=1 Tax=Forsythia ovata TaxID=205694 RepID=A0ABD1TTM0_9LAMI
MYDRPIFLYIIINETSNIKSDGNDGWRLVVCPIVDVDVILFVKEKVSKVKPPTCIRGSLIKWIVNRGMCTSGRNLRERANKPTSRTDPHNISVKICPTQKSNLRCRKISHHVTSGLTNSPIPLKAC